MAFTERNSSPRSQYNSPTVISERAPVPPQNVTYNARIARQVRQFLLLLISVSAVIASLYVIIGQITGVMAINILGGAILLFGVACFVARVVTTEHTLVRALAITCTAMLVTAVSIVVALPLLLPTSVFFVLAAISLPMLVRSRVLFLGTGIAALVVTLIIGLIGVQPPQFALPISWDLALLVPLTMLICIGGTVMLFFFIWSNLTNALHDREQSNIALLALRESLEQQVVDRTTALGQALDEAQRRADEQQRLTEENTTQRQRLREMSVPVLPVLDGTLVVPLVGDLDTYRLDDLLMQALDAVSRSAARWLVLDITGVPVIDTQVARGLREVLDTARLLGTTVIIVGVRPEVAQTMVGLGLDLGAVRTQSSLQAAIESIQLLEAKRTAGVRGTKGGS